MVQTDVVGADRMRNLPGWFLKRFANHFIVSNRLLRRTPRASGQAGKQASGQQAGAPIVKSGARVPNSLGGRLPVSHLPRHSRWLASTPSSLTMHQFKPLPTPCAVSLQFQVLTADFEQK